MNAIEIMLKSMGIDAKDIAGTIKAVADTVQTIDARLTRIEQALNIPPLVTVIEGEARKDENHG